MNGIRYAPPPFRPTTDGKRQIFPIPTAAPVAARINPVRDDQRPIIADVNGAENIRLNINEESNSESSGQLSGDKSTGWLAQPGVYLHDLSCGFQPQTEVVDCKP
jgi:hypothetical protein